MGQNLRNRIREVNDSARIADPDREERCEWKWHTRRHTKARTLSRSNVQKKTYQDSFD